MLIVLSGLPGTGKTTIAQLLVQKCRATYLRIDTIEQALAASSPSQREVGTSGYAIAYELASINLRWGGVVLADAVNPLAVIRAHWRAVAHSAASAILEVEIVCSDTTEHKRRVESRTADIPGHTLPTWEDVLAREYQPWTTERLVIDSAKTSAQIAASQILASFA